MTTWDDVKDHKLAYKILDHGFIYPVDNMGNDAAIVQAARVSYGAGTKSVNEDRGLIRYLLRHEHMTPFEMCEIKFHVKMPIFIARQWIRHRTANVNEYSGRYSIMSSEFYLPDVKNILPQSKTNKQGRDGTLDANTAKEAQWLLDAANEVNHKIYLALIGEYQNSDYDLIDCPYDAVEMLGDDFEGIARETARQVLPVSNYTEMYWKCDLRNIFNFIKLRADSHAQWEIRQYADAMYDIVKQLYPMATEAFDDYIMNAKKFSSIEVSIIKAMLEEIPDFKIEDLLGRKEWETILSKRELLEFVQKLA